LDGGIAAHLKCLIYNVIIIIVQRNEAAAYPAELDALVDKRMLFKVEVGDGNLHRSYTVKKLTDDDDTVNRLLTLHGLDVCLLL